jgi:integrase
MIEKYNFTRNFINSLKPSKKGKRDYYKDIKVNALEIMVTDRGTKSFKVTRKKDGKVIRVTLGHYPDLSIENARKKAFEINAQISSGINPNEEKNKLKQEITLSNLIDVYVERHSKKHKITWHYDDNEVRGFTSHLAKKKISSITNEEIRKLHEKIAEENGIYQANRFLATLKAIYNKAIEWGYEGSNPALRIKQFKETSRDRFIQPDELPRFFKALEEELNDVARDYFYIALYTGARKANVLSMKWEEINFTTKEWRIPKTKNGEPITIPLITEATEILKKRFDEQNKSKEFKSDFVFPSKASKKGYLQDPKKAWKRILISAKIKDLRIHDIRRTLGSYQAITGASLQIIGKSLGHKSQHATQIYSRMNLDPVRKSIENAISLMIQNSKNNG